MKRRSLLAALGVTGAAVVLAGAGAGVAVKLQPDDAFAIAPVKVDPNRVVRQSSKPDPAMVAAMKRVRALAATQSLPAIKRQLRKLGLDPALAVIQRGRWNYAGPNCPGRAWTCTKGEGIVVQLATGSGGSNQFKCTGTNAPPTTNTCVIIQNGPGNNTAECRLRSKVSTVTQSCTITQVSVAGQNKATVYQEAIQVGSSATQEVEVNQTTGGAGNNTSSVLQVIGQLVSQNGASSQSQIGRQLVSSRQTAAAGNNWADIDSNIGQRAVLNNSTTATQTQFAYQTIVGDGTPGTGFTPTQDPGIDQTTLTGDNFADVDQRQGQSLDARYLNNLTQNQNVDPGFDVTVGDAPCDEKQANTCAIVEQHAPAGENDLTHHQIALQDARARNVPGPSLAQNMGNLVGGVELDLFQNGLSDSDVDQDHLQNWNAPPNSGGVRVIDPRCCQHQVGDPGSTADIDQLAYQQGPVNGLEEANNGIDCSSAGTCNTHSVIDQVTAFSEVTCSSNGIGEGCFYEQECTEETCNFPGSTTVFATTEVGS